MSADQNKSKEELIAERQANLPLPEQPPVPSDFNSADARTVNIGSGGVSADISKGDGDSALRGPAAAGSAVREDGSQTKSNTAGLNVGRLPGGQIPSDAVAGSAKGASGLKHTENPDYGYPQKNDPAGSLDETRGQ